MPRLNLFLNFCVIANISTTNGPTIMKAFFKLNGNLI